MANYIISSGVTSTGIVLEAGDTMSVLGLADNTTVDVDGDMGVASGGTADNTTVYNNGYMWVDSGGTADNTTVGMYGELRVSDGGAARNTHVGFLGNLKVSSGGVASNTIVEGEGLLTVLEGGIIDNASTINEGANITISSGGTANNTHVSCGAINISGGTANSTTVTDLGRIYITDGGVASDTIINSGHIFEVYNGGIAKNTIINNVNSCYISSGGVISDTTISCGGINVYSGGSANNIIVANSNAHLEVNRGASVTGLSWTPFEGGVFINQGAFVSLAGDYDGVYYGYQGDADNTHLISHADVLENLTVDSKYQIYVMSGGTAKHLNVKYGGNAYVWSGGKADTTEINSGGYMAVFTDGSANGVIVYSSGVLGVFDGGAADNITITSGGKVTMESGATADFVIVSSGANLAISSGASVTDLTWTPFSGVVSIAEGAFVSFAERRYGVYYGSQNTLVSQADELEDINVDSKYAMHIFEGGSASNLMALSSGAVYVWSNGSVEGATIDSKGYMAVYDGAVVNNASVGSDGRLVINSGGMVDDVTVESRAVVNVYSSGLVSNVKIQKDGTLNLLGGMASDTVVSSGASLNISSGGTAIATDIKQSGILDIASGGVIESTTVGASIFIHISEGVVANNTTVNKDGKLFIYDGGIANSTTVNSRGSAIVSSGGTINDTILNSNGYLFLSAGAFASGITVEQGSALVSSGASVNTVIVNPRGRLYISAGGQCYNIIENGGGAIWQEGAEATFVSNTISGLSLNALATVHSGTTAIDLSINSGCSMFVYNNGIASGLTVNSGGSVVINKGGFADGITAKVGGEIRVSEGGSIDNIILSGGRLSVSSGGTATNVAWTPCEDYLYVANGASVTYASAITGVYYKLSGGLPVSHVDSADSLNIGSGGSMIVMEGGIADNTFLNFGSAAVWSGGIVNNTTLISYGGLIVSGGTANSITVESKGILRISSGIANTMELNSGGLLYVYDGGTGRDLIANSGASAIISSGGKLTGKLTFEDGALVSAYPDAIIDFDLSQTQIGDAALVNNLSILQGSPDYTLTITTTQSSGVYALADGASNFATTITVQDTAGTALGTLELGQEVKIGNASFTLNLDNSALSLNLLNDTVPPTVTNVKANITTPTNTDVIVTAVFADDVELASSLYKVGASGQWTNYVNGVGVTVSENNTTLYFKAIDAAGNESEIVSYTVTNIDKVAPVIELVGDTTTPLQKSSLTASTEAGVDIYYSTDNSTWSKYTDQINITANGTWYFKATDAAGNIGTANITFANIDTVAPVITLTGDTTTPLQKSSITASTEDGVDIYYSSDNSTWSKYTDQINITANGTWYFKATDAAGNTGTANITFANIDTTAPVIELTGDTTTPLQKSSLTASTEAGLDIYYSADNTNWTKYTGQLDVNANGTWYFKATDAAGNIGTANITFANIDTTAPVIELTGDTTTPLQQSSITASTEAGLDIYYSTDNTTWSKYTGQLDVTANGTWYFKATDAAGNIGTANITFANIDTTAPEKPTASADITSATNGDVTVSALFSDDSVTKEYSLDGTTWTAYTAGIKFTQNGSVSFRGTDAAGNISDITTFDVSNIDKVAPVIELEGDTTTPLQKSSLTASSEDGVDIYYSGDSTTWSKYTGKLDITANGTWYFKATDAAGNEGTANITFANIDTTAPVIDLTGDTTTPLQKSSITASTEAGLEIYYSTDNTTWTKYTSQIDVTANGTWYFKATDAAGNTGTAEITFANIDTVAPVIELTGDTTTPLQQSSLTASIEDGVDIYYSTDNVNWSKYTGQLDITANGTWYFKATDAAGNEGTAEITFTNIDITAPVITLTGDNTTPLQKSSLTASTEDGVDIYYSTDNAVWEKYTDQLDITDNGTWYFKATDAAGNTGTAEITFGNIDTLPPEKPVVTADVEDFTNGNVTLEASFSGHVVQRIGGQGSGTGIIMSYGCEDVRGEYSFDNENWQEYTGPVVCQENCSVWFRGTDEVGNVSEATQYSVTNIDKVAPEAPQASADITDPTNGVVTVTAQFTADHAIRQYKIGENGTWKTYSAALARKENGTLFFRGQDAAGNWSDVSSVAVTNIDRIAPSFSRITIDESETADEIIVSFQCDADVTGRFYSLDGGEWTAFSGNELHLGRNGSIRLKLVDAAGNEFLSNTYDISGMTSMLEGLGYAIVQGRHNAIELYWNMGGSDPGTAGYDLVVSVNGSALALPKIADEGLEIHGLGESEISWQVAAGESEPAADGPAISFRGTAAAEPQVVQAVANDMTEALLARPFGTWNECYQATHAGCPGGWKGTDEVVALKGKNMIADVYAGTQDTTLLYLTDDANGDALFVDDIYTELPGELGEQQSRLARIDCIYAGAGDDLIDMTSQRFEYTGQGVTIHGGLGNDVIWAGKGDSLLFGDAGNDRLVGASGNDVIVGGIGNDSLHGGGGDDIFCFCGNWGQDTVEQLADGKVTLWFADGDESKWNAETLTYSDGRNSVVVSGVGAENITLKFGDDTSAQYAVLLADGAFSEFSSEHIFENSGKGMLA